MNIITLWIQWTTHCFSTRDGVGGKGEWSLITKLLGEKFLYLKSCIYYVILKGIRRGGEFTKLSFKYKGVIYPMLLATKWEGVWGEKAPNW